jgi:hypothetical protein
MDQLTLMAIESFERDFVDELLARLIPVGYTEVWLGNAANPHWSSCGADFIIAAPKRSTEATRFSSGRPSLWCLMEGKMGCGNGLREADQCQLSWSKPWPGVGYFRFTVTAGHYVFCDGVWEKRS